MGTRSHMFFSSAGKATVLLLGGGGVKLGVGLAEKSPLLFFKPGAQGTGSTNVTAQSAADALRLRTTLSTSRNWYT